MFRRWWPGLIIVPLALIALWGMRERQPDIDTLVQTFADMAIRTDYDSNIAILKWQQMPTIRYRDYTSEDTNTPDLKFLETADKHRTIIEKLSRITGASKANTKKYLNVYFLKSQSQFQETIKGIPSFPKSDINLPCSWFVNFDKSENEKYIVYGVILISLDDSGAIAKCIESQIIHGLGITEKSDDPCTVLNDKNDRQHLTNRDALFLRVLYDSRLKPGMGRRNLKLIRQVMQEALAEASFPPLCQDWDGLAFTIPG